MRNKNPYYSLTLSMCLVIVCLVQGLSVTAHAALNSADWKTSGDGLITIDTATGLEWLDVSYTVGRSYNDVSAAVVTPEDDLFGWDYATLAEVEELWINAGIDTTETFWTPINYLAVIDLIALLGATNIAVSGEEISGLVSDPIPTADPPANYLPRMFYDDSVGEARAILDAFGYFLDIAGGVYNPGSYLVRIHNPDSDGDGILDDGDSSGVGRDNPCTGGNTVDCDDNCDLTYNPDQSDLDGQDGGDVCDMCPNDPTDNCDPDRSGGGSVGPDGGTISTPDGSVTITIPPGALDNETSISITDSGNGTLFELATNLGNGTALFEVTIEPSGLPFNVPITITFSWLDEGDDGTIDGTSIQEENVVITKDNVAVTDRCKFETGPLADTGAECDQAANTFSFQVTSLSDFTLFVLPIQDLLARAKSGKVDLVWTHVQSAVSYDVYRSDGGGPFTHIANTTSTYSMYADFGLTNGVEYCYKVRAVNAQGNESADSNEACTTPSARRRR